MRVKNLKAGKGSWQRLRAVLIGLTMLLLVTAVFTPGAWAAKNKALYKFTGGADGGRPVAGLIFDSAGNLYGTTPSGGAYNGGTVFRLTPNGDGTWTQSVLHSFQVDSDDGLYPTCELLQDAAGNLYGTTQQGGVNRVGTVFELISDGDGTWSESVLHSFDSDGKDGINPYGGLVFDQAGSLYGTTFLGGTHRSGTVFKLTSNGDGTWTESVLHSFHQSSSNDGGHPMARLVFDAAGNLYGTTHIGGADHVGTVFSLTPQGDESWKAHLLHTFKTIRSDGNSPFAGSLIFDSQGRLYGTTQLGGAHGAGTVFRLTPNGNGSWKESLLHSFAGKDGSVPLSGLVFDALGNLYGTTGGGGPANDGTVFALRGNGKGGWQETVIDSFRNHPGAYPLSVLIRDSQGNLYGTTQGDGSTTFGSVFEINP